jgi:hypothetical protein
MCILMCDQNIYRCFPIQKVGILILMSYKKIRDRLVTATYAESILKIEVINIAIV